MKSNVALTKCYICGKDDAILLATRYNKKGEPVQDLTQFHGKAINTKPCNKCREYMEQGIILISVRDNSEKENPYRTGGWCVIKEEIAGKIFNIDLKINRILFIEDALWEKLNLPASDFQKEQKQKKDFLENNTRQEQKGLDYER